MNIKNNYKKILTRTFIATFVFQFLYHYVKWAQLDEVFGLFGWVSFVTFVFVLIVAFIMFNKQD